MHTQFLPLIVAFLVERPLEANEVALKLVADSMNAVPELTAAAAAAPAPSAEEMVAFMEWFHNAKFEQQYQLQLQLQPELMQQQQHSTLAPEFQFWPHPPPDLMQQQQPALEPAQFEIWPQPLANQMAMPPSSSMAGKRIVDDDMAGCMKELR